MHPTYFRCPLTTLSHHQSLTKQPKNPPKKPPRRINSSPRPAEPVQQPLAVENPIVSSPPGRKKTRLHPPSLLPILYDNANRGRKPSHLHSSPPSPSTISGPCPLTGNVILGVDRHQEVERFDRVAGNRADGLTRLVIPLRPVVRRHRDQRREHRSTDDETCHQRE